MCCFYAFCYSGFMFCSEFQVDNGASSEKPMPVAENSKELCTPEPAADLGECGSGDAQIAGAGAGDGMSSGKGDAAPAVAVAAPIADGTSLSIRIFNNIFIFIPSQ